MDGDRFDTLTRTISSRRALSGAIAGALTALLGFGTSGAAPCPPGKKRCRGQCIPRRRCCRNGECQPKVTGRVCIDGHCACPPARPRSCGGRCIAASNCCNAAECPTGATCAAGACICPAGASPCGARCALPEGAPCSGFEPCCSQACDFLVGGGTCASCDGWFCSSAVDCCPGTLCIGNRCGGCRHRAVTCDPGPGGQPCCDSACSTHAGTNVCLSGPGERCKHNPDCASCYFNSSSCAGACVGGACQR